MATRPEWPPANLKPTHNDDRRNMRNIFRALLAGWGAKKFGGGCITTIILFIVLYWLLGQFF